MQTLSYLRPLLSERLPVILSNEHDYGIAWKPAPGIHTTIHSPMALQSCIGPWPHFQFRNAATITPEGRGFQTR
jgi:hypothetical protein